MPKRPPSTPPVIPGFEHVKLLGSGGFADVFLYQQLHPRRQVAVKVLLSDSAGAAGVAGFTAEANVMAQLATHPAIVSIYEAGVSVDGRPYLVMEYCSRPNLQVRHRRERFSEVEALRVGIQIAGAVETAHRSNILHRDIKPANILVTDYGRPALTDFGISATTTDEVTGMSVPWSPPESFQSPPQGDVRSDVYSLGATLYTLVTNRSPFEVPGASNTELDVISRIHTSALPPIGRADISPAFEDALRRSMAKNPSERFSSAMEFARALQRVQVSLGLQPTTIDVIEEEIVAPVEEDGEARTRFRGVTSIDAQTSSPPAAVATPGPSIAAAPAITADETTRTPAIDATVMRSAAPTGGFGAPAAPPLADTINRQVREPERSAVTLAPRRARRTRLLAIIASAVVVIVGGGVAVALLTTSPTDAAPVSRVTKSAAPQDALSHTDVPQVTGLAGTVSGGSATFTWTNPAPQAGDTYMWRTVVVGQTSTYVETATASITIPAPSTPTCIEVLLRRADGEAAAEPTQGCAP